MIVDDPAELGFRPTELPALPPWRSVVMADPAHFDVLYVINPHMEGWVGRVDRALARRQWETLRATYARLGLTVHVVDAAPGLPDLVFTANQSFPFVRPDGAPSVVLSRMRSPHRAAEPGVLEGFYEGLGIPTQRLDGDGLLEGMGDLRWHPGHRLLYGGWGFRTDRATYDALVAVVEAPVVALRLVDARFYHLDTCLCPLTNDSALYVPEAFDDAGRALLAACFPRLLPIPLEEATRFAANGCSPDGRHLLLQAGNPRTEAAARAAGLEPIPLDTSEFMKSGGSVFCMTLLAPLHAATGPSRGAGSAPCRPVGDG